MGVIPAVLAIDGGNSKTDVALVADDGTLLASLRGPGASRERYGTAGAMRLLGDLVRQVAERAGLPDGLGPLGLGPVARHTSACLAGADLPEEEAELTEALLAQGWSETAVALNDTFAVLRAGTSDPVSAGAAVTCGAGINCVAVAPGGRVYRYLSWGRLTGDLGGGGWLGAETLWHAIRAEDGRGPDTALRGAVAEHFGAGRVADVAIAVHKGQLPASDLRSLTGVLLTVAASGDAVARSLAERQAEEVCVMAANALRQLGVALDGVPVAEPGAVPVPDAAPHAVPVPVVLGGGVLEARDPLLLGMIGSRLAALAPGAVPRVIDVPPVAGAALLGLDYCAAGGSASRRLRETYLRQHQTP